jgi:hypothetical protein
METETPPDDNKYLCSDCNFSCNKNSDWLRHISTKKHLSNMQRKREETHIYAKAFQCEFCERIYQTRTGLWKHAKKCDNLPDNSSREHESRANDKSMNPIAMMSVDMISKIVVEIHKQMGLSDLLKNSEEMVKTSQEIMKMAKETPPTTVNNNTTTNNNTTNTAHFNVNFFLNEKCKDAINFTDFINSITLNQIDLQTVVKHGHIEGNAKIIAELLDKLGVYRRPIHCMDAKRETVYIRENNEWEREDSELPRIKRLANVVSHKVIQESSKWHEENPNFMKDSAKKEESLHIMTQVFGGVGDEEKKLVKQIVQQVEVDKIPEKIISQKKNITRINI